MIELPNITIVCITTRDYGESVVALNKCLEHVKPFETIFFTDVEFEGNFKNILIPKLNWAQYNEFLVKEIHKYIKTSHFIVCQHDGYILDGSAWRDEWLQYDYIGAKWGYKDGRNVGNGGFSLRSTRLHNILAEDTQIEICSPEDEIICRLYRNYLEKKGIKYAPESVADAFSFECFPPKQSTFGFHQTFFKPWKTPVILKRSHSLGDVIMMEPVMAWYHERDYRVILDIPSEYFNLFAHHYYKVEHRMQAIDLPDDVLTINLDMAYEVEPRKLALLAYYKVCGIKNGEIRNPRLNYRVPGPQRLMEKYIVLHTDNTFMSHRNTHGFDWDWVAWWIESHSEYKVFRVGRGLGNGGKKLNTDNENMLAWMIGGADYFIGIDSGPAQIAVAAGVKSMIFFGSVNPVWRYADLTDIHIMQRPCPVMKDGCYHTEISKTGVECEVDRFMPPCVTWSNEMVAEQIQKFLTPKK